MAPETTEIIERVVGGVVVVSLKATSGDRSSFEGNNLIVRDLIARVQSRFVVNLAGCSWIDSKGLGELVRSLVAVMREGGGLKLAELPDRLRTIFSMTNLTQVFEIFEHEAEAILSYESEGR